MNLGKRNSNHFRSRKSEALGQVGLAKSDVRWEQTVVGRAMRSDGQMTGAVISTTERNVTHIHPVTIWVTLNGTSVYSLGTFKNPVLKHIVKCVRPVPFCARDDIGVLVVSEHFGNASTEAPPNQDFGTTVTISQNAVFNLQCDFNIDYSFSIQSPPISS